MKNTNDISLEILQNSFTEKKQRNAAYSLRAFSRDVGISAPQLSRIFNGKRKLSAEQACKIAIKLQFNHATFMKLITAVVES